MQDDGEPGEPIVGECLSWDWIGLDSDASEKPYVLSRLLLLEIKKEKKRKGLYC